VSRKRVFSQRSGRSTRGHVVEHVVVAYPENREQEKTENVGLEC
jgi:hypothetical protein